MLIGIAMIELIASNLRRHLGRTVLTALGIGLGIAVITSLLGVTTGLRNTASNLIHLGGSDLGVFQEGVADPTASVLPVSLARRLQALPDVAQATPVMLLVEAIPQDPAAVAFGADPASFFAQRAVVVGGRRAGGEQAMVGDRLASEHRLAPGGTLTVKGRPLPIAGVYHSGILFEDAGAIIPLALAQRLSGRADSATTIPVQLRPGIKPPAAGRAITTAFPGTQVISDPQEAARAGANNVLISKAVDLIVVLALIVGGITVTNTVAMSVLERQGELALLRTVGWGSARVTVLVVGEGVAISLLGAALGLLLGVLGSQGLVDLLGVGAYVSPAIDAANLGEGLLIGLAIGILGGLYPAWRVTRIRPATALARA